MRLRLAFFLAVAAAVGVVGLRELRAAPQRSSAAACVLTVPQDWGEFKGESRYGLVFEDKEGTLRLIETVPCSIDPQSRPVPNVAVEVRRR